MNKFEAENSAPKAADAKGKYEPPKLTVLSLDEAQAGPVYGAYTDGVLGSGYSS